MLPPQLVSNFEALGVHSIYPWQSSCLLGKGLLAGEGNLIYTAPTGGGKSLVADVLLLKRIIDNPTKKAILVLPYVALVQEKLRWLRKAAENVSKNAEAISVHPQTKWRLINSSIRVAASLVAAGQKRRGPTSMLQCALSRKQILSSMQPLKKAL